MRIITSFIKGFHFSLIETYKIKLSLIKSLLSKLIIKRIIVIRISLLSKPLANLILNFIINISRRNR